MADEPIVTQFASQLKFDVRINRCPHVNWHVQSANVPGLSTGRAPQGTPFTKLFHQGDHLDWGVLEVSFKVDERFNNWFEIFEWLRVIGFPKNHAERDRLKRSTLQNLDQGPLVPPKQSEAPLRKLGDIYSQITLGILNSHNNPIIEFQFYDAWPVALSPLDLTTRDNDIEFLTANVTFSYTYFNVIRP